MKGNRFFKVIRVLFAVIAVGGCLAGRASASVLTVGNCASGGYATIQLAVAAAASGDTIQVCPGTYPELVTIDGVNLTLEGIPHHAVPTIIYPNGELPECRSDGDCSQISVRDATVQIASLTVNGSNFKPTCKLPVGIGLTDSAGNITTSTITNHVSECDESGLEYQGDGIAVGYVTQGNYSVDISNNTISNFGLQGIVVDGQDPFSEGTMVNLTGKISNNTVMAPEEGQYGIDLEYAHNFSITSNTVSSPINPNPSVGILLFSSNHLTALLNTINGPLFGIYTPEVDSSTISFNKVSNSGYTGVDLQCGTGNSIGFNNLTGTGSSTLAGVLLSVCGPPEVGADHNTIVSNSISNYCSGVLEDPSDTDNNIVFNSFHNIGPGSNIMKGDNCP